jgi:hypothetical protein
LDEAFAISAGPVDPKRMASAIADVCRVDAFREDIRDFHDTESTAFISSGSNDWRHHSGDKGNETS